MPLLRPRWLVIAAPILLQHLLSWRSSEWNIYFHYAAPLLPLFWMATVEAIAGFGLGLCSHGPVGRAHTAHNAVATRLAVPPDTMPIGTRRSVSLQARWIPAAVLLACVVAQVWLGPAAAIGEQIADWPNHRADRVRKNAFISQVPAGSSVVAGLPYLSHLAMREKLYSLHYILKGLKTLSHATYEPPPPTDYVLIDYNDTATFDAGSGYYHPAMKTKDGRVIPSSDQLFYQFLKRAYWTPNERDELALFQRDTGIRTGSGAIFPREESFRLSDGSELWSIIRSIDAPPPDEVLQFQLIWKLVPDRTVFRGWYCEFYATKNRSRS